MQTSDIFGKNLLCTFSGDVALEFSFSWSHAIENENKLKSLTIQKIKK